MSLWLKVTKFQAAAAVGALLVLATVASCVSIDSQMEDRPQLSFSVDVETALSAPVPSDFASFSVEVPCMPDYIYADHFSNKSSTRIRHSFINLMRFLKNESHGTVGPNIRIGGNSADCTYYIPSGSTKSKLPTGDYNVVSDTDILSYGAAAMWDGTVTVDLNLRSHFNNSVEYAAAAVNLVPTEVLANFEIGNEPELFQGNGIRPHNETYTYNDWRLQWLSIAEQMKTNIPNVNMPRIQGAVFCCTQWNKYLPEYIRNYTNAAAGQNYLSTVSHHFYPMAGKGATIEKLMRPDAFLPMTGYKKDAAIATKHNAPFVIGEGNSAYNGGGLGVSNAMAAALWGIDVMATAVSAGIRRWNFHGCPRGIYQPISVNRTTNHAYPTPLYYGMWVFTRAFSFGSRLVAVNDVTINATSPEGKSQVKTFFTQWATHTDQYHSEQLPNATQRLAIILSNKAPPELGSNATAVDVVVHVGRHFAKAMVQVLTLSGPGGTLAATKGLSFNGQTFDGSTDGTPTGGKGAVYIQVDDRGDLKVTAALATTTLLELVY